MRDNRPVATTGHDLAGFGAGRVLRQALIFRLPPLCSFGGGPNLKWVLRLWFLHRFARPVCALAARLERAAAWLRRRR